VDLFSPYVQPWIVKPEIEIVAFVMLNVAVAVVSSPVVYL